MTSSLVLLLFSMVTWSFLFQFECGLILCLLYFVTGICFRFQVGSRFSFNIWNIWVLFSLFYTRWSQFWIHYSLFRLCSFWGLLVSSQLVTEQEPTRPGQLYVKNFCTEFHANPTCGLVAATVSQAERWQGVFSIWGALSFLVINTYIFLRVLTYMYF
jgi:hypothetical protein